MVSSSHVTGKPKLVCTCTGFMTSKEVVRRSTGVGVGTGCRQSPPFRCHRPVLTAWPRPIFPPRFLSGESLSPSRWRHTAWRIEGSDGADGISSSGRAYRGRHLDPPRRLEASQVEAHVAFVERVSHRRDRLSSVAVFSARSDTRFFFLGLRRGRRSSASRNFCGSWTRPPPFGGHRIAHVLDRRLLSANHAALPARGWQLANS